MPSAEDYLPTGPATAHVGQKVPLVGKKRTRHQADDHPQRAHPEPFHSTIDISVSNNLFNGIKVAYLLSCTRPGSPVSGSATPAGRSITFAVQPHASSVSPAFQMRFHIPESVYFRASVMD